MITRAKISAVRANSFVVVEQFSVFPGYSRAALINFFVPDAVLIRGRSLTRVNTVTIFKIACERGTSDRVKFEPIYRIDGDSVGSF